MSFPLDIAGQTVASMEDLDALVRTAGDGPPDEARATATALLEHHAPVVVAAGARLATALGDPELVPAVLDALDGQDLGVLLAPDPADPRSSVEDTLLRAAGDLLGGGEPDHRTAVLIRLRNAGLPDVELSVLCRFGTADELRRWLPAVLSEDLDEAGRSALADRVASGDDGADVIRQLTGAE